MIGKLKRCPDCEQHLPHEAFARNRTMKDGLQFYCRACCSKRTRESRTHRFGPPQKRSGLRPTIVPNGHKWCPECNEIKLVDQFSRNRTSTSGRTTYCKPCTSVRHQSDHLRRTYGLTTAAVEAMRAEQDGLCAICREAPAAHIDHDHATGRVRGLLCFNCNGGPGQFRDRPDVLLRAISYLDPSWQPPVIELYRPTHRIVVTMPGHRAA